MYKGSCLCGAVEYEYRGELGPIIMCHCHQCRKAQGTAFATNCSVESNKFNFISGRDRIKEFESTPGKKRAFCSLCGSPIYSRLDKQQDTLRLRIGTLDTEIQQKPTCHIFTGSKAEWYDIHDELEQYPEFKGGQPALK